MKGPVLAAVAALVLAACGAAPKPEPDVRTIEVKIPVPVACIPADVGAPPIPPGKAAALAAAADPAGRYQLVARWYLALEQWAREVWPAVQACKPPPAPEEPPH